MSNEIRAAYDQLEQVATRFASQSQVIQQMIDKVRGSMDNLQNDGWVGRGSDAFFAEMTDEVLPASTKLQQVLDDASQVTRQIVQTVKQAEEEAAAPFRGS